MLNIKTFLVVAAFSSGVVFAMPVASLAIPASAPVKIQTVNDGNVVNVHYRKKWKRWARYCRYAHDWRCYRRSHYARYRYHYYDPYYEPYYGYYAPYPYYGYYRPRFYGPGIGFSFRF